MSAASAPFSMANRCHLNEAMELLDPPPPSSLTVAGIAKAYDCLLSAATASPNLVVETGTEGRGRNGCDPQGPDKQGFGDDSWCALQADIYRGLLLSAHLLLGMAPREEASGHKKDAGREKKDENGTSERSPDPATSVCDGAPVVLTPDDVTTLLQTQRRCRLLLFELAVISNGKESFDRHATDWHDDILPRSSFQLLRECFELDNSNPDGNKQRLVSLDIDSNEDDMCHLSACDIDENQDAVAGSGSNVDNETGGNEGDDDDADIGCIGFDRKLLAREENDLLDIAMPVDLEAPTRKRSPKKGKKRKRNDKTNSPQQSVARQGYLVLVDDEIFSKDKGSHDTPPPSSNRYFAKIDKSGVLCLRLAGNKKASAVQFYLGGEKCICEPRTFGDTFHFVLKGTQRLNIDAASSSSKLVDEDFQLVFMVDEETGGGLAEGFAWVTAITDVAKDSSIRREQQDKIKEEWAVGGEWEAAAAESTCR